MASSMSLMPCCWKFWLRDDVQWFPETMETCHLLYRQLFDDGFRYR